MKGKKNKDPPRALVLISVIITNWSFFMSLVLLAMWPWVSLPHRIPDISIAYLSPLSGLH